MPGLLPDGLDNKTKGRVVDQIVQRRLIVSKGGNNFHCMIQGREKPNVDPPVDCANERMFSVEHSVFAEQHQAAGCGSRDGGGIKCFHGG